MNTTPDTETDALGIIALAADVSRQRTKASMKRTAEETESLVSDVTEYLRDRGFAGTPLTLSHSPNRGTNMVSEPLLEPGTQRSAFANIIRRTDPVRVVLHDEKVELVLRADSVLYVRPAARADVHALIAFAETHECPVKVGRVMYQELDEKLRSYQGYIHELEALRGRVDFAETGA